METTVVTQQPHIFNGVVAYMVIKMELGKVISYPDLTYNRLLKLKNKGIFKGVIRVFKSTNCVIGNTGSTVVASMNDGV